RRRSSAHHVRSGTGHAGVEIRPRPHRRLEGAARQQRNPLRRAEEHRGQIERPKRDAREDQHEVEGRLHPAPQAPRAPTGRTARGGGTMKAIKAKVGAATLATLAAAMLWAGSAGAKVVYQYTENPAASFDGGDSVGGVGFPNFGGDPAFFGGAWKL